MRTFRCGIFVAVLSCLLAASANADAPQLLNYQGRLTDPSGNPKNGTFSMQFAVYDAETGGNQLPAGSPWSETQSVTVTDGVFNVLLGSVAALPANLFEGGPSDAAGPLRFLQVTVGGEVLVPRRRIVSAAYAIQAGSAATGTGPWEHIQTVQMLGNDHSFVLDIPAVGTLHMLVLEQVHGENNQLSLRFQSANGEDGTHRYVRLRPSDNTIDILSGPEINFPVGVAKQSISGVIYFDRISSGSTTSSGIWAGA